MIVTKDNVKEGDLLYLVSDDKRDLPEWARVEKIGRKYAELEWGRKIVLGTDELFNKAGVGSPVRVFKNDREYAEYVELENKRYSFRWYAQRMLNRPISGEDMDAIRAILSKYETN